MALKEGAKSFAKFLPLELALGSASVVAGGLIESANWGSQTGLEEDYVGGATYGALKEAGGTVGSIFGSTAGAVIGQALIPVPVVGALIGGLAGGIGGYNTGRDIMDAPAMGAASLATSIHRTSMAVRRLSFGVDFRDNASAHTMRQRAVQEMSGSLLNARQYLGNESMFLHG